MSITRDGRGIACDGDGCGAQASAPVALRHTLHAGPADVAPTLRGWLVAVSGGRWRHYCPRCLPHYIDTLVEAGAGLEKTK